MKQNYESREAKLKEEESKHLLELNKERWESEKRLQKKIEGLKIKLSEKVYIILLSNKLLFILFRIDLRN
jgi:hypothetical protein